ncbi:hypothetical protein MtrunA17_Chr2g0321361 [Medicago truncatula]|uniref:Transmembrane protein n=1 Tax=Medicago truncatula TaxID=3880 RepID=A0A396JK51_MEDTR|nr:hypothetical protein MtrunA17_Chr2g0321361 [Medicago truncatula]
MLKKCYLNLLFFVILVFQTKIFPKHVDSKEVSPRTRLSDGRHLAYLERGFSEDKANYKMKRISDYLKLLTFIPQAHQTQQICKSFCHTVVHEGTQISPKHDDSKEVLPRIRLRDGRHLACSERGFPMAKATYKINIVHGFGNTKRLHFPAPQVISSISLSEK